MHALESYLRRLHEIRSTERGTPELSYRAALENLLNVVGSGLDPAVQATAELANAGAGRPDFGLFETRSGDLRSAVEVKPVAEDTPQTADGRQVARYWKHYGCVLVTNYRDFLLVLKEPSEKTPQVQGRYQLAADEETFWRAKPHALAKQHGEGLLDFLAGAMTRTAPITRPADLAADLARHAREAKRRLAEHDISAVEPLAKAMEQALGLHFQGDEGAAFFRSSLVQTLFYGLFSGWMLWRQNRRNGDRFDWKGACEYLALPLIGDLYEEIARPRRLADLGLREPLEWATASLNRVVEEEFFQRFQTEHAITLFYEPFLQAFDPELRKELGVWYTPPEIVRYMVGRVDQLLRSELGIADGLADDQVFVLDPAAGTGSYLVEVARRIHQTLTEQGHGSLAAARVKRALRTRIFGFEILPAPYVVAHLQLGVFLRSLGVTLAARERFEVFLTNALTGWEPPKEPKSALLFPELEAEAERATTVKRNQPILVILGNPPYNGFVGVAQEEEKDLLKPYFDSLDEYDVQVRGLHDLYVRFFRLAERRIADVGKRGIVCLISNFSWLDGQRILSCANDSSTRSIRFGSTTAMATSIAPASGRPTASPTSRCSPPTRNPLASKWGLPLPPW
ncbi:MAG: N-6 DNA methylase [Thermoguttaceae bacterium]